MRRDTNSRIRCCHGFPSTDSTDEYDELEEVMSSAEPEAEGCEESKSLVSGISISLSAERSYWADRRALALARARTLLTRA